MNHRPFGATSLAVLFLSAAASNDNGGQPTTSTYTDSYHSETVIDAPPQDVWPQASKIKSWMTAHDLVYVAGTPDAEGEIVKVIPRNIPPTVPKEHFAFYEVTKIIPLKQIVLKVYSAPGGTFGTQVIGFDTVTLFDENGRTRVAFDLNDETTAPYMNPDDLEKHKIEEEKTTANIVSGYWNNLRDLVHGQKKP